VTDHHGIVVERLDVAEPDNAATAEGPARSDHETQHARAAIVEQHIDHRADATIRLVSNGPQSQEFCTCFHFALLCIAPCRRHCP
jgi:hypothetical protein